MTDLKAIVEAMYNASAVGDFEKVESFLTDDFRVEEAELLPFAGLYTGKQCLRELFPIVMETMGTTVNNKIINDFHKGLDWFRETDAKGYMKLLD